MTNTNTETAAAVAAAGACVIEPRMLAEGFSWPECPRWHDGLFYFSDMYTATLKSVDAAGNVSIVVDATGRRFDAQVPIVLGGFGWLPDGRLIVTSMHEKLILVHGGSSSDDLQIHADVSRHSPAPINDMVVDEDGRAYVTQLGFDLFAHEEAAASPIIVVEPNGLSSVAEDVGPLMFANGIAISADGTEVYTAEVLAQKITVIDRAGDGSLSNPRRFAKCPSSPDGIGLDEDGGVWAALPGGGFVTRFTQEGITEAVSLPRANGLASACLLGGPDRSTLYITVGVEVYDFERSAREGLGSIWVADVSTRGGNTRP